MYALNKVTHSNFLCENYYARWKITMLGGTLRTARVDEGPILGLPCT